MVWCDPRSDRLFSRLRTTSRPIMWQRPRGRGQRRRRIAPSRPLDRRECPASAQGANQANAKRGNRTAGRAHRCRPVYGAAPRWRAPELASVHGWLLPTGGEGANRRRRGRCRRTLHCVGDLHLSHSSVFVDSSAPVAISNPLRRSHGSVFPECPPHNAHRTDTKAVQQFWLWRLSAWCSATSERALSIPSKPC